MIKKLKNIAKNLLAIPAVRTTYEGANRAVLAVGGSTRAGATGYSVLGSGRSTASSTRCSRVGARTTATSPRSG